MNIIKGKLSFLASANYGLIALQKFLFCFTEISSHYLSSLFVNQSTSYSQINL